MIMHALPRTLSLCILCLYLVGCTSPRHPWLIKYKNGHFKHGLIADFKTPEELQEFIKKKFAARSGSLLIFGGKRSKKSHEIEVKKGVFVRQLIYSPDSGKLQTMINLKKTQYYQYTHYDADGNITTTSNMPKMSNK